VEPGNSLTQRSIATVPALHDDPSARVTIISAQGRSLPDLGEFWQFRHLIFKLVWRNFKIRFKQSLFGVVWVVLQPIAAAGVFTVLFGEIAHISSGDVPYPIFVLVGLVAWQFFSRALLEGTSSLVAMSAVLSKVYVPRLIVPVAAILTAAVDFLVVLVLLLLVIAVSGHLPLRALIVLPLSILLVGLMVSACSLWTSAGEALFRDIRVIVGFGLQFGLFITPVVYPVDLVPERWRALYQLDPLVPLIDLFRWSVIDTAAAPELWSLAAALGSMAAILVGGLAIFARVERVMMDRI
jgi:lipopolysaccharide transport system permease protein